MSISVAGVIGAALGFYLGWIDWKILKGMVQAAELKNKERGGDGGFAAKFKTPLNWIVFVIPVIGFPIIGYWAGFQLAG